MCGWCCGVPYSSPGWGSLAAACCLVHRITFAGWQLAIWGRWCGWNIWARLSWLGWDLGSVWLRFRRLRCVPACLAMVAGVPKPKVGLVRAEQCWPVGPTGGVGLRCPLRRWLSLPLGPRGHARVCQSGSPPRWCRGLQFPSFFPRRSPCLPGSDWGAPGLAHLGFSGGFSRPFLAVGSPTHALIASSFLTFVIWSGVAWCGRDLLVHIHAGHRLGIPVLAVLGQLVVIWCDLLVYVVACPFQWCWWLWSFSISICGLR